MNVAGSAETEGMLCWQDVVYTEVCDPKTMHRVPYGQRGTPVYTQLERTSQPMIRLASGDLTLWVDGPNPLRTDVSAAAPGHFRPDRRHVHDPWRKTSYPSEIDAALNETPGYGGEHQIVITREASMDELLLRVEADAQVFAEGTAGVERFRQDVSRRIQKLLGLRANAEIVARGHVAANPTSRRVASSTIARSSAICTQQIRAESGA